MRNILSGDETVVDQLEASVRERPAMERQAFYNTEPLDLAADLLCVEPTDEQKARYKELVETIAGTSETTPH